MFHTVSVWSPAQQNDELIKTMNELKQLQRLGLKVYKMQTEWFATD